MSELLDVVITHMGDMGSIATPVILWLVIVRSKKYINLFIRHYHVGKELRFKKVK